MRAASTVAALALSVGVAFAATPSLARSSTNLAIPVVPHGNGIACDIGPNYTGSIPAGAQAAGFTHCAANYDFTSPAFANIATWLDCKGASNPLWYIGPGASSGSAAPCSAWSITTDPVYGGQTLQMHYDNSYGPPAVSNTTMLTAHGGNGTGAGSTTFPLGSYWESEWRTSVPQGSEWMAWYLWSTSFDCNGGSPCRKVLEVDFDEAASPGAGGGGGINDWGQYNFGYPGGDGIHWNVSDLTAYTTYGIRITEDGVTNGNGNVAYCQYGAFMSPSPTCTVDNSPGWDAGNPDVNTSPDAVMSERTFNILESGGTGVANMDLFVKRITVFVCNANWQTQQCVNNPVLSTAP